MSYDRRDNYRAWFDRLDERRMIAVVENDEGEEVEVPFLWEVCTMCSGKGSHVNPSIDSEGIPAEDFRDDPEFAADYFGGTYDQPCVECDGRRVSPAWAEDGPHAKWLLERERERAEHARCSAAERAMGA